ncbi:MAG: FAD-dependent monooxygenase [Comamonas sp.]
MRPIDPVVSKNSAPAWKHIDARRFDRPQQKARVTIVGAGPVGMTLAIDLAQKGHAVTLLSKWDFIPKGSKAICFSKRSLDIFQRLGLAQAIIERSVTWNMGEVYWKDQPEPIYCFDMLPVKQQQNPGFVNLQQYYLEEILLEAMADLDLIDARFGHSVQGIATDTQGVRLQVQGPQSTYEHATEWLIACDGNKSTVRSLMHLEFEGRVFEENFLIADIKLDQPAENKRRFWFDPPFNPGMSALMHKQPDGVWRLDFQLGWDIDKQQALEKDNVDKYVRAMLGDGVRYQEEWYSIYTFQCRRMREFVHGPVIFAGDSAHLVSPFGARGCNGGLADADNLAWKLDLLLRGKAAHSLIDTYNTEAIETADENLLNSTRSTNFLTPKSVQSKALRDAVLELAKDHACARPFVNSGRLSTAVPYRHSRLNVVDQDDWHGQGIAPGHVALDAPLDGDWLLNLLGHGFVLLHCGWQDMHDTDLLRCLDLSHPRYAGDLPLLQQRYALAPGYGYLIRPDQYVTARWMQPHSSEHIQNLIRHLLQGQ